MTQGGSDVLASLQALLGGDVVLPPTAATDRHLVDHRRLYRGSAVALAQPRSTAQVAMLLAFCNERRIGVVPQGGNTSYCGGATPDETGTQLLLSLEKMSRVRALDPVDGSLIAEAGCLLATLQQAAADVDRLLPLSLGSEGSCQLGGNLSTNAGGTNVLRYGMARDLVLGLEVVLPDGRVLDALRTLRKDNTGYDVKSLFLGAEGTLGVITAAALRLFPASHSVGTALIGVADVAAAVTLLGALRIDSGDRLSSFELMPRIAIDLVLRHIEDASDPLEVPSPWYVLCEATSSSADDNLTETLTRALGAALERGLIRDAAIAQNERQRLAFWRLRENVPEAQRRAGGSLKHDISVPVARLPDFVARAAGWIAENIHEGDLVAYGHVGDGNLHFNVSQRSGATAESLQAREAELKRVVHDMVHDAGGSFSAEHGIGRLKVAELERYASTVELELMRAIKRAFDPNGIMNPGKVLRT
jgi:FAD/FMN-containing dehydrogenase